VSSSSRDAERRLHDAVDRLEPKFRALLQSLVRVPSPIGSEGQAQDEVGRAMRDIGLATEAFDIDPAALSRLHGFNPTPQSYDGRPCVVGVLRGTGGGRSLALNAHIDTAPVDPLGAWTHGDPYSGHIAGTLLYGRGAWDDKAGVIEALMVAEAVRTSGIELRGDLVIKSVIEDEATGNGTLACLARGYRTDAAVIVDGTWPERFIVSHLGQLWFRVRLDGRSAPASVAGRGANPLAAVGPVLDAFTQLVERRNVSAEPWGADRQPWFVNIGAASGGAWPGAVPTACELRGQCGFPPPETPATVKAALAAALDACVDDSRWPTDVRASIAFEGLETGVVQGDAGNAIVRLVADTVMRLHGRTIQESIISGHCDLRHYYGAAGGAIPACLYGPGGGKNAHAEDEYFDLSHLPLVARNLASIVLEWCH
jgi:acetylornithine deacetylase